LEIYQLAKALMRDVYSHSKNFPKHEQYGLISQLNRAVVSIGANIAEGNARRTAKDRIKFINIAKSSLSEVIFLLDAAKDLDYLPEDRFEDLMPIIQDLDVKMYNFAKSNE